MDASSIERQPQAFEPAAKLIVLVATMVTLPSGIAVWNGSAPASQLDWGVLSAYFTLVAVTLAIPAVLTGRRWLAVAALAVAAVAAAGYSSSFDKGARVALVYLFPIGFVVGRTIRTGTNEEVRTRGALFRHRHPELCGVVMTLSFAFATICIGIGLFPVVYLFVPLVGITALLCGVALLTLAIRTVRRPRSALASRRAES